MKKEITLIIEDLIHMCKKENPNLTLSSDFYKGERMLPLKDGSFFSDFSGYITELENLKERLDVNFNLVVMGEFKSGKSTLINSLLKHRVASVDVTEMTCTLNYITRGEKPEGEIFYKDKGSETVTLEELDKILMDNREEPLFRERVEKIEIRYDYEPLKELKIWDTPGLGSMTKNNRDKVLEFIPRADAVLWVFDGTLLGQVEEKNYLDMVRKLGKYVFAIVNKMDAIDDENAESAIKDYIEDIMPGYFNRVFFCSSLNGWEALQRKDDMAYEHSGVAGVLNYLENWIFKKKKYIAYSSTINTLRAICESIMEKLKQHSESHMQRIDLMDEFSYKVEERAKKSLGRVRNNIREHVYHTFLEDELQQVLLLINQAKTMDDEILKSIVNNAIREDAIKDYSRRYIEETKNQAGDEFNFLLKEIQIGFEHEMTEKFQFSRLWAGNIEQRRHGINEGVMTGGFVGTSVAAIGASIYLAVFSVLAPKFTFLGALGIVGLPVAVLGFITTLGLSFYFGGDLEDIKSKCRDTIRNHVKMCREKYVTEFVDKEIYRSLEDAYVSTVEDMKGQMGFRLLEGKSPEDVKNKVNSMKKSCEELVILQGKLSELNDEVSRALTEAKSEQDLKNFVISRSDPVKGKEKIRELLQSSKGYVKINDRYFSTDDLAFLEFIPSEVVIRVLLYELDNRIGEHRMFFERLEKFRRSRTGTVRIKIIKYKDKSGTPVHDRFIFTENWAVSLGNSLGAIGGHDIIVNFLESGKKREKEFFDCYWDMDKVLFKGKEFEVIGREI